ncbi:MAG: HD domain-containing protein [Spirochaetales bacterium]|nr:HD domain-containing protein [Spirochaetales bacterium]
MKAQALKKIFSPRHGVEAIEKIIADLNISIGVYDQDGRLMWGEDLKDTYPSPAPIKDDDKTVGLVYSNKHVEAVATLLSYLLRSEIEKKYLAQDLLEKYKEINLLYKIAENINAAVDVKETAHFIIGEAINFIKTTHASLMLLDEESHELSVVASYGLKPDISDQSLNINKIIQTVLQKGSPQVVNDVVHNEHRFSFMCAPLKTRDKTVGVINISHENKVHYTAEDLKFFTTLASQGAMVIENARLYSQLRNTFLATAEVLAGTIEKRDPYTGGHTKRVMDYALAIGKGLHLNEEEMTRLRLAAILHDIGKIGVRDRILLKQAELDQEEIKNIKAHTILGEDILKSIDHLDDILPGVRHHHERFDGMGYPDGLAGENIDIAARIIAVADAYDAMTTDRPYREALSHNRAIKEIKKGGGTQFDPAVVDVFLKIFDTAEHNVKESVVNGDCAS